MHSRPRNPGVVAAAIAFTLRAAALGAVSAIAAITLSGAAFSRSNFAPTGQTGKVAAIWRVQHVDFHYANPYHYYACDALQDKVRAILRAMGAHEAIAIDAGCTGQTLVSQVSARISFAAPVEATTENLIAATTFDARDQLVARLRELRLPTAAEVERFPAAWRRVSLSHHARLNIEAGDCDLLNSIRKQVMPQLRVKVKDWRRHCAWQATRLRATYEIEALIPS